MKRLLFMSLAAGICSCESQPLSRADSANDLPAGKVTSVRVEVDGVRKCLEVKSVLSADDIETRITDVSIGAYGANGALMDAKYYESGIRDMSVMLNADGGNVYVLANMGDMTAEFPISENDIADMEYYIPSFADVGGKGIPMCGKAAVREMAPEVTVSMERLFAKICVRIMHKGLIGYSPGDLTALNMCNKSIYVRQANSRLLPFAAGGSRVENVSDVMNESDCYSDLTAAVAYGGSLPQGTLTYGPGFLQDVSLVLYVPENIQGELLPDNEDPYGKVYGNIDGLKGKPYGDLCTYIEFNAMRNGNQGYSGNVMYRYYLGADSTSDFSVERNCQYDLTLDFTEDGFFVDSWKVTRDDDWKDNRTLRFAEAPYIVSPGGTEDVMIHFHRYTASETHSEMYPERWVYSLDEEAMKAAGLTVSFDPETLVTGVNGYRDFCLKVSASSASKVGKSFPITIRTTDGSISDLATITVAEKNSLGTEWDFRPEYVSQYGMLKVTGHTASDMPLTCSVSDPSMLLCCSGSKDSFKIVALGAGSAHVTISNADGSKSSTVYLDVKAPVLYLDGPAIELNPDGEPVSLAYGYKTSAGLPLTNVDAGTYASILKPVISDAGYFAASVSDSGLGLCIDKLNYGGGAIVAGSVYDVKVSASSCSAVTPRNLAIEVTDPFNGIVARNYGAINDYTLLGMMTVNSKIRGKFVDKIKENSSFSYEGPVPDADQAYVSAALVPRWTGRFSDANGVYSLSRNASTGRLSVTQKAVSQSASHSAGVHDIMLSVMNRHSSESLSMSCGTLEIYVHAVIAAQAVFGKHRCDLPGSGRTFADVYNSLPGRVRHFDPLSTKYVHYMDVSAVLIPQADGVYVFEMLERKNPSYDSYTFIRNSREDGEAYNSLLYSVADGYGERVGIGGEPSGIRGGINNHIYRALYLTPLDYYQTETNLRKIFMGYEAGSAGGAYAPAFEAVDRKQAAVSKYQPFYFSPSNCDSYRDSEGKGYHVFHFLESLYPATSGWLNLL